MSYKASIKEFIEFNEELEQEKLTTVGMEAATKIVKEALLTDELTVLAYDGDFI